MERRIKTETWDKQTVPEERWGKDHYSTLLYVESRCVDAHGVLSNPQMRTSRRNRRLAGMLPSGPNIGDYATRLKPTQAERAEYDSVELTGGHDDWECLQDLADAGYLTFEVEERHHMIGDPPLKVVATMTPAGEKVAAEARSRRARTGKAAA